MATASRQIARRLAFAMLSLLLWDKSLAADETDCRSESLSITDIGERFDVGQKFPSGQTLYRIFHTEARYLRALISINPIDCDWHIIVRDRHFRPIQIINSNNYAGRRSLWTNRVAGNQLILDWRGCKGQELSAPIFITNYIAMSEKAKHPYYSRQDDSSPSYQDLYRSEEINPGTLEIPEPLKRLGDSVGFLMSSYGRTAWSCSGVMLQEGIFLTNWHCGGVYPLKSRDYWRQDIVNDTIVDVSWDGDSLSHEYIGAKLLAGSSRLDYAILEVAPISASGSLPQTRINPYLPKSGAKIEIVHHVEGMAKQLSRCNIESEVILEDRSAPLALICDLDPKSPPSEGIFWGDYSSSGKISFTHKCDTEQGSSGAPIFDETGQLVGIHYAGFARDRLCQKIDTVNKAIKISSILTNLQKCFPSVLELIKGQVYRREQDSNLNN